jgi:SAM-dependent methyltransferase
MGFEWAYRSGVPPWDIGRPQPALVQLAEKGEIEGSVIDVGCGTGENALYLASRGLSVVGVDAAPTAISRAREKAVRGGLDVAFEVADALDLSTLGRTFDVAVDCGLFHVFSDPDRVRFVRSLGGILRPGSRYFMLCFSDEEVGTAGPRRVSQAEIRAVFESGWRVDAIEATRFATVDQGAGSRAPRAWLASLTRLGHGEEQTFRGVVRAGSAGVG